MKGNFEVVKVLVEAGALLNRTTKDGRTALYLAVQEGHVEVSKYLTDQYPKAITQTTQSGRLPIQAAAAYHDPTPAYEMTTYLLSHTHDNVIHHRDNSGRNLLLDAALSQNLTLLRYLIIDQGANISNTDSLGRNMIHHAAMTGHLNVLEMILNIKPQQQGWDNADSWDHWTPLMHAARQGHFDIVQFLVETVHVNKLTKDKHGRTAKDIGKCVYNNNKCY
ncbi:ankyrin repeat-containing domain protein [Cokeromyces recurvatus]|uniref:ankyrin repeat-containing domain protein n=1 Tax=Cokeromyces recurvatus TaxID=90255 RepID=UPI00221FD160|nr:ankyrin repeat-containing domain protein [Cokeromyces recurvatus]KAI7903175.1 ankyrin repeat-containing domain protein [Cokeromyces recurvatus]